MKGLVWGRWLWGVVVGASLNEENSMWVGAGVGVAEEHRRWGPVVRLAARAVFYMGRIRDEEEDGLGDVGSSSNHLKWSTDPNDKSHATCMQTCLYIQYHHRTCLALLLNPSSKTMCHS